MRRVFALGLPAALLLAACAAPLPPVQVGPDGEPVGRAYRLTEADTDDVQYRVLDAANALRQAAGLPALQLNAAMNAAAATHARDMSIQNRPWHFGSDGSSPIDRVRRAGYTGTVVGENISETYETELQTLTAWMDEGPTRKTVMDPRARNMGVSWFQEPNGKIWWTMITGT
ncbi:divisome-associated lipoprotein DalA [Mesobaculum littorinae]|uniref:CAP domain-containing protein n=1 Tax=Mesobaculum littorinae TaxID=2486419 RepID=UPI001F48223D|nr:CAP domain-containing protein [Mesobaculum littorinae]